MRSRMRCWPVIWGDRSGCFAIGRNHAWSGRRLANDGLIRILSRSRTESGFQSPAGPQHPRHDQQAHHQKRRHEAQAHTDTDIGEAVETPPEAADQIDDGVEQGDRAPDRRQDVDAVEAAAQKRQRSYDQQRHDLKFFPAVGPDAQHETEQAEAHRRQQQKGDHPERVLNVKRYEKSRRQQDYEANQHGLGGGCADIAQQNFGCRDWGREQLVNGARPFGHEDTEGAVAHTLSQHRQHDQARYYEGAIRHAANLRHARPDGGTEHHEVKRSGEYRSADALHQSAEGARHLEAIDGLDGIPVHAAPRTSDTKISSSELWLVSRSRKVTPTSPSWRSSAVIRARPPSLSKE